MPQDAPRIRLGRPEFREYSQPTYTYNFENGTVYTYVPASPPIKEKKANKYKIRAITQVKEGK